MVVKMQKPQMTSTPARLGSLPLVLLLGEQSFTNVLSYVFENEGFSILATDDRDEAVALNRTRRPNIIAIDTYLPSGAIRSVIREIGLGQLRRVPVVLLTPDKTALEGRRNQPDEPDAVVIKPFDPHNLIKKIRVLLEEKPLHAAEPALRFDGILIDIASHKVYLDGKRVPLGPIEFRLLEHLVRHPGQVFSRSTLLHEIWGNRIHVVPRTVDVHMSRIRKALSDITSRELIRTVRSVGYSLDSE